MEAVSKLCNRAVLLEKGNIKVSGLTQEIVSAYSSRVLSSNANTDLQNFVAREGSGDVKFVSARLLNKDGNECSQYQVGDDLQIEFQLRKFNNVGPLTIAVELSADDGLKIANMIDFDSNFQLSNKRELQIIRVTLHDMRFYPGRYLISLFVGSPHGRDTFDRVEDCLCFNIEIGGRLTLRTLPRSAGFLFLTPQWQLVAP
jgi:lipopolysaccharide transport system ATP-binding protein